VTGLWQSTVRSPRVTFENRSLLHAASEVDGGWDLRVHVRTNQRLAWCLLWCDDEMASGSADDAAGVLEALWGTGAWCR
jgi:hypothetical protein